MSERSEDNSIVTRPLIDFTHLAFRRGWFGSGAGCILAKRGNEGGFLATPAFTSSTPDATLSSRLVYLTRHGHFEHGSSRSTCTGTVRSAASSGIVTPCSSSSRFPGLAAGANAEATSSCASQASRSLRHAYVYCTSEDTESVTSALERGKLTQQYCQEDAAGLRAHPCAADISSFTKSHSVQPNSLPVGAFPTALGIQVSREAHAPSASSVRRDDSVSEKGSAASAHKDILCTSSYLQLSGPGWSFPIKLSDSLITMPEKGQSPAITLSDARQQQGQPQPETLAAESQQAVQHKPPSAAAMQRAPAEQRVYQPALKADTSQASAGLLQLTGDGWALPFRLHSQHTQTPQEDTEQSQPDEAASECSSDVGTAGTIELAGQGWAMPVRLHETLDEGTHMALVPPEQTTPLGMPPPLLALKAGIQVSPAQDLLNSRRRGTLDTGSLSPRERILLLERTCGSASLPLPGQVDPVIQYPRLCPLTRLAPCNARLGNPSGHSLGSVPLVYLKQSAERRDTGHTIAGKANAGKLLAGPFPHGCTSDSSTSGETGPEALIAAVRGLSDRASECSHSVEHTDHTDRQLDVDGHFQQGASSIDDRAPAVLYTQSKVAGTPVDNISYRLLCENCSLVDEPQEVEAVGKRVPCQPVKGMLSSQHSSTSSVYDTPWPSLSSMSQASAASIEPGKGEGNLLYACSSSGASTGLGVGCVNPYYACSTSSASSGSALPQRRHFWQHAAPTAQAPFSFTAQGIPEAEASEEDVQEDAQLPGRTHDLLPLLLVPLKLKGDCCNVAVLNASAASVALSQTLPAGAEEIVAADSHVTCILNAHIGLPDEGGKLQTVVPVVSLADFPDAAAAAQHMKAVMLAYPRTSAIIIREAGILCWGLMAHAQALVELYEYLLKCSCDMAQEAPPQRKSCVLGIRRTDTANEELHLEQSCNASSTGQSSQHLSASVHSHDVEEGLEELVDGEEAPRPVRWNQPLMVIISCGIILGILGAGIGFAIRDALKDGSWWKVAARAATLPIISALALFGTIAIVSSVIISLGPIAHVEQNSKTYSAVPPPRWQGKLPRVTIQMPVYLEGFEFVIKPSIRSVLAAIAAYKAEGGSASLLVNDDGLQLLDDQDREERLEFYRQHDIGFVARPPHGKAGFLRAGRFKKASNMNYSLEVSRQVESFMQEGLIDQYEALQEVRLRTLARTPDQAFLAGGDVRIGAFILLVDSDTRVPEHCILPTVTELMLSPEVAFTQHYTTPLQVSHDYFENAMAFFTKTIYNAIMLSVSGGDISPLVGHNAFLRWEHMKECAFQSEDGQTKYWSDLHVSEDFDIAIRFQVKGYTGRYITYTGPDFKEGLSLSIHDEISRMRKYAFGCSELVFNPLSHWLCRGPISKLFRTYLWNARTPITNKLTIVAYICIYIALAIAWPVAVTTYFLNSKCAWYAKTFEGTFEISMTCLVVFSILTPVGNTFMMYRLGVSSLLQGAWQNLKYSMVFFFFFNGLSFHLSAAFASHLLGFKMSWGSTTKEVADTNFFKELHATFRNYRSMYIVFSVLAIMTLVMTGVIPHTVPPEWRINDAIFIVPISFLVGGHLLAPLVLNPSIMRIKF